MRRFSFTLLRGAVGILALSGVAHAQAPAEPTSPGTANVEAESLPAMQPGYWARDKPRLFAATTIDLGYLYLRPRLSLGYGKPFALWAGFDVNPIATSGGVGGYGGLRVQIPGADLRVGARGFRSFEHQFLAPQDQYSTVDLQNATGGTSQYVTLEAELSGALPVGPGSVLFVLTAASVQGVPSGRFVYEETLRVIADPPAIYRVRTGYALSLGSEGNAHVGVVGEVLDLPGRGELLYRAGMVATFAIDDHLEALAILVVPVWGRDSLGIAGGDFGELGLRYRWAFGRVAP